MAVEKYIIMLYCMESGKKEQEVILLKDHEILLINKNPAGQAAGRADHSGFTPQGERHLPSRKNLRSGYQRMGSPCQQVKLAYMLNSAIFRWHRVISPQSSSFSGGLKRMGWAAYGSYFPSLDTLDCAHKC